MRHANHGVHPSDDLDHNARQPPGYNAVKQAMVLRSVVLTRAALAMCLLCSAASGCKVLGTETMVLDLAREKLMGDKWVNVDKVTGCRIYDQGGSIRPVFTVALEDGRARSYGACTEHREEYLLSGCDPEDALDLGGPGRDCHARMAQDLNRVEVEGSAAGWQFDVAPARPHVARLALFWALVPCLGCVSLCAAPFILIVALIAWSGPVFPRG